jgi:toxin ParE1/3/4
MARLIWTVGASEDFEEICSHLARTSERFAQTFARQVTALAEDAATQPFFGAEVPEYQREDVRERQYHKYRIIYRVRGDEVEVLTVIHGARLLPRPPA